jgi:hypothetical protein
MSSPRLALLVLPIVGLVLGIGCDAEPEMQALDTTHLPERFACGDLTLVAASPDGDEALLLGIDDGLAAAALESGEVVEAEYELPDERITVRWVAGSNVYRGQCGRDSGEAWQLHARRDAVSGHVHVLVDPGPDGQLDVRAQIDEVVLDDGVWLVGTNLALPVE